MRRLSCEDSKMGKLQRAQVKREIFEMLISAFKAISLETIFDHHGL